MSTTVDSLVQTPCISKDSPLFLSKINAPLQFDHQMIMRGFKFIAFETETPRKDLGILYRVEPDKTIIVQSYVMPDWSYCLPSKCVEIKEYVPKIIKGKTYYFQLTFNSMTQNSPNVMKKKEIINKEICDFKRNTYLECDARTWLQRRDLGGDLTVLTLSSEKQYQRSYNHVIPVNRALVFGTITVTNPELLLHHIRNGIGRSRAYGCGLISLAPAIG
jgi:CRISPR system Cascade subunit CasE